MRTETAEAYARLVTAFVTTIEDTGAELPADIAQRLAESPLKACELLNELAISTGALDEQTDAAIACIYETMDAKDARTPADDASIALILAALAQAHREKPAPEPDPEAEPEAEPEPTPMAVYQPEPPTEAAPKPKRRGRRAAHEAAPLVAPGEADADPQQNDDDGKAPASEDAAPEKPLRKRQRKPRKNADDQQAAEGAPEAPKTAAPGGPAPVQATLDLGTGQQDAAAEAAETSYDANVSADAQPEPAAALEPQPTTAPAPKPPAATPQAPAPEPQAAAAQPTAEDETVSVDQAVAILGMSRPTVYKLIESGKLPAHKKGRSWRISSGAVAQLAAAKE